MWRFRVKEEHLPQGVQEQVIAVEPEVAARYYEALVEAYGATVAADRGVQQARARWKAAAKAISGSKTKGTLEPSKERVLATVRDLLAQGKVNPKTGLPSKKEVVKTGLCSMSTLKRRIADYGWSSWESGLIAEGIEPLNPARTALGPR